MSVSICGVIVDVLILLVITGNAILGYRKGLTKVIFNIFSTLIAIVLVLVLYKPITNYVINNTTLSESMESFFEEKVSCLFEEENITNTQELQENNNINGILKIFVGNEIENVEQYAENSIGEYVSIEISHKVIKVLIFFILFVVIKLLLCILRTYIELIANLPIIRVINGSGGMIYGIIKGFLIIYLVFAILSLIMPMISDTIIITSIQTAKIGSKMFNNNIILNLIF